MPSFDPIGEFPVASLSTRAILPGCPCCDQVQTQCCLERTLPKILFGTMTDASATPGNCSCSDGLSFTFGFIGCDLVNNCLWQSELKQSSCTPLGGSIPTSFGWQLECRLFAGNYFWVLTSQPQSPCGPPLLANSLICLPLVINFTTAPFEGAGAGYPGICCNALGTGAWRMVITE